MYLLVTATDCILPRAYRPQRGRGHVTGTLAKFKPRLKIVQISVCTNGVQTAAVTIISYIPLSDLNFAVYTGTVLELHALSPFGVYKPLILHCHAPCNLLIIILYRTIPLIWSC